MQGWLSIHDDRIPSLEMTVDDITHLEVFCLKQGKQESFAVTLDIICAGVPIGALVDKLLQLLEVVSADALLHCQVPTDLNRNPYLMGIHVGIGGGNRTSGKVASFS